MFMIDEALIEASLFLQPLSFADQPLSAITAKHYRPYERMREEGGVIGSFNTRFEFVPNNALTQKYQILIPVMAQSMMEDHKHSDHKLFHIASLTRGSLEVKYEWELRQASTLDQTDFKTGLRLKYYYGVETLLVLRPDLPTYDILIPSGVPDLLRRFPHDLSEIVLPNVNQ